MEKGLEQVEGSRHGEVGREEEGKEAGPEGRRTPWADRCAGQSHGVRVRAVGKPKNPHPRRPPGETGEKPGKRDPSFPPPTPPPQENREKGTAERQTGQPEGGGSGMWRKGKLRN